MTRIFLVFVGAGGRRWPGILILGLIFCGSVVAQPLEVRYPVVPYPILLEPAQGEFVVTPATKLVVASPVFTAEAEALNQYFENYFGRRLQVSREGKMEVGKEEKMEAGV